jgi:serine protease Do
MYRGETMKKKSVNSRMIIFIALFVLFLLHSLTINSFGLDKKPAISDDAVNFLTKTGEAMAEIADAVKPAVVNISTTKTEKLAESPLAPFFEDPFFRRFFDERFSHPEVPKERKTASLGSGVIVSNDGYILTNNHVVKDAEEIKVLLSDKREFKGTIIGTDPKTDIAVIKIDAQDLSTITMGNSDALRVGEVVLAIGSPYGLDQTVTMGIVSAVGRANVGIADYEDFIQTDAAINPGNSGGALVTAKGELVGINTAIFSRTGGYQGIGFAIPSNMAKAVMGSLIREGKVVRGWLGVTIQQITSELAQQFNLGEEYGALVGDVIELSPAEKAGIMRGDVIIEFDGKQVEDPFTLRNTVANTPPGTKVKVKVIREGKTKTVTVEIGELQADAKATQEIEFKNVMNGVNVQDLTPVIYRQMNIPEKVKGVIVTNISPSSPAFGKLIAGDIIQEINRKALLNVLDYQTIVAKVKPDEDVLLLVFRRGTSVFVTISPN